MDKGILDLYCVKCKTKVDSLPTIIKFQGQETYLFYPIFCENCLSNICEKHSTICANCGQSIPPYSQVGVLKSWFLLKKGTALRHMF